MEGKKLTNTRKKLPLVKENYDIKKVHQVNEGKIHSEIQSL